MSASAEASSVAQSPDTAGERASVGIRSAPELSERQSEGIADLSPLVALVAGVGASLAIDEFFIATPLSKWGMVGLCMVLGTFLGRWRSPRRWWRGFAAAIGLVAIVAALLPMLARVLPHLHELPGWTGWPTAWLFKLFGFQAAVDEYRLVTGIPPEMDSLSRWNVVVASDAVFHRASLTMEKFIPLCSVPMVVWCLAVASCRANAKARVASALSGLGLVVAYQPIRLTMAMLVAWELDWVGAYWHPLLTLASFLPLVAVLSWWRRWTLLASPRRGGVAVESEGTAENTAPYRGGPLPDGRGSERRQAIDHLHRGGAVVWGAGIGFNLGLLMLAVGFFLHVPGSRAGGQAARGTRVLIDDAHSNWEWSDIPFYTGDYSQQAAYNYFCLRNFLLTYYDLEVNKSDALTPERLSGYDVVVIKTPTRAIEPAEIDALESFVLGGGGLYMIGDHTNLFGMSSHLNPLAERFRVAFEHDDTYQLITGAPTGFTGSFGWTHPIVAPTDYFEFETSCSLRCPIGSEVMTGFGAGSEYVDYGHVNFFGDIAPQADERWGGFVQMCALNVGAGRVIAFSDSTVFSNFSMFFDDKPILALRTIEWLARRGGMTMETRRVLLAAGVAACCVSVVVLLLRGAVDRPGWVLLSAIVLAGATFGLDAWSHRCLPNPTPRADVSLPPYVRFDRSMSVAAMPSMLDFSNRDNPMAFDAFFVNLQRLGIEPYVDDPLGLTRPPAFRLVINPIFAPEDMLDEGARARSTDASAGDGRLAALADWVRDGGVLLAIGSAGHGLGHAFETLMQACGVRLEWRTAAVDFCWESAEPHHHRHLSDQPNGRILSLGAFVGGDIVDVKHGAGRAVFVTNGRFFSRKNIGSAFEAPSTAARNAYEIEYLIANALLRGQPLNETRILEHIEKYTEAKQADQTQDAGAGSP